MTPGILPENVKKELQIYLAPEEKISGFICTSGSTNSPAKGEIWLVQTNESVYFHTVEFSKEPVVALLKKSDIKVVEYFQRPKEISLTFFPKGSLGNSTRITFPISQQVGLEIFCEEIADLIYFKKETRQGIKVFENGTPEPDSKDAPVTLVPGSKPVGVSPAIKAKTIATTTTQLKSSAKEAPQQPPLKAPAPDTSPKIASEKIEIPKSAKTEFKDKTSPSSLKQPTPIAPKAKETSTAIEKSPIEVGSAKFVLIATLVSVFVAFLWYKFFRLISRK